MSQRDNVDVKYIESEYSSGDSKNMKSKRYQEENNNEVDELSKSLSEMGCIVEPVKRPPNICVETCVYESEDEKTEAYAEEDAYSDEFEEDKSEELEEDKCEEEETESVKTATKSAMSDIISEEISAKSSVKLLKSQISMSSHKPPGSDSGRSTSFGSVSVPPTRRNNMSFTNERLREIERHNHILLSKILSARNTRKSSIPPKEQPSRKPVPAAAVCRRNQQRQIDHDNMILLKKIQCAKSSAYSVRR